MLPVVELYSIRHRKPIRSLMGFLWLWKLVMPFSKKVYRHCKCWLKCCMKEVWLWFEYLLFSMRLQRLTRSHVSSLETGSYVLSSCQIFNFSRQAEHTLDLPSENPHLWMAFVWFQQNFIQRFVNVEENNVNQKKKKTVFNYDPLLCRNKKCFTEN